jgi:hypothetical protein
MRSKRIAALVVAGIVFAALAAPGMAMDKHDRIWLRDTVIGGGIGLGLGLISDRDTGAFVVAGLVLGAVFGYFDAEKGFVDTGNDEFYAAAPPPVTIDSLQIEGMEHAVPVLKATLFRMNW